MAPRPEDPHLNAQFSGTPRYYQEKGREDVREFLRA